MGVAAWIVSVLLCIAITMIVIGAVLRPYVAELHQERNHWRLRAEVAEAEIDASVAGDVRVVEPIDASQTLDLWLKGVTDEN